MLSLVLVGVFLYMFCVFWCTNRKTVDKGVPVMSNKDVQLDLLLQEYDELRGELKQRIEQRDNFAVQYVVACAALVTIAFSNKDGLGFVLYLLPIVTIFYSVLIFNSYRVHNRLVEFIRENIEKKIADKCGIEDPADVLWESYCKKERVFTANPSVGGRKRFFECVLYFVPALTFVLLLYKRVAFTGNLSKAEIVCNTIYCIITLALGVFIVRSEKCVNQYSGLNKLSLADYVDPKPRTDEKTKAIFLDRDGTLHVDKVMTHRVRDLELFPAAKNLIKLAHEKGYKVIIVTNQSAIGKGYYSVRTMHHFNNAVRRRLKYVDAIYFCPHTTDFPCRCHKPNTGMIDRAVKEFNVDLSKSIMVGDRMSDIKAGFKAGIATNVFVTTGIYGEGGYTAEDGFNTIPHETCSSLGEVMQYL